ncbi:MAG: hypothetical protein H6606_09525 [Flavobacteriales bacterium]|nr:hypothetical protein [Flavobacteriales bacterium]
MAQRPDVLPLFDHPIPGNLLLDLATNPSNVEKHSIDSGLRRSTYVDFIDALLQLRKMGPNGSIIHPDSFNHYLGHYSTLGFVPLAVLDYRYSKLDSSVYKTGVLQYDTIQDRLQFITPPSSYLTTDTVTLVHVPYELDQGWNNFIIPRELFLTNLSGQKIQIDFHDGLGFRGVALDMPIPVYYEDEPGDTSEKYILFKFEDRIGMENIHPVIHGPVRRRVVPGPDKIVQTYELPQACLLETDPVGDVKVYIRYGQENKSSTLVNPVVFIEGFDIDANPKDDRYGSMGWVSLMTGFAYDESGRPTRENIKDITELVQRLYEGNYDLVYIDFKNGANDLFANGNAVMRVLKWVEINSTGGNGISVLGASMGGVLARYAIRRLELEECISCVKLYGTFDSPHKGANIPLAIQHATKFLKDESGDALAGYNALMSKAAQQMLIYHIDANASSSRTVWQNWLDQHGHPQSPVKIALTNGSPEGSNAGFNPTDRFYYFEHSYGDILMVRLALNALPDCENSGICNTQVFEGILPIGSKPLQQLLNKVLRNRYRRYVATSGWTKPLDNASGGQGDWPVYIDQAIRTFLREKQPKGNSSFSANNKSLTTFIPTFSALDLNEETMQPDLKAMIPDLYNSDRHPFDAIFYPQLADPSNQRHVQFDKRPNQNIDWLMLNIERSSSAIPNRIPDQGRFIYNSSGRPYTRYIQETLVDESGILQLNGNGPEGFQEDATGTVFQNRRAMFQSHPCGTHLIIEGGAKLILGEDDQVVQGGKIAEFYLEKGDLTINDGSLILYDSSVLRIGKDARLNLGAGHSIQLNGANAKLIIEGNLTLNQGAVFSPGWVAGSEPGTIHFVEPGPESLVVNGHGNFIMSDTSSGSIDIQWFIEGGVLSIPENLEFLSLKHTRVTLSDQATIQLECEARLHDLRVSGDASAGCGLRVFENSTSVRFAECSFTNLYTAIDVHGSSEKVQIKNSDFDSCRTGILFELSGWKVSNCMFNLNDHGVIGPSGDHPNLFIDNELRTNSVGLLIISESDPGITSVIGSHFFGNSKGAEVDDGQIALFGCCTFESNTFGVQSNLNSIIYLDKRSPLGHEGGSNTFRKNTYSISSNGGHIYLAGGYNNFIADYTISPYNFITGSVPYTSPTLNTAYELGIAGNYWHPIPSSGALTGTNLFVDLMAVGNGNPVRIKPMGSAMGSPNTSCGEFDDGNNQEQGKGLAPFESGLALYPNPTNGVLKFRHSDLVQPGSAFFESELFIFDLSGREICRLPALVVDQNTLTWELPVQLPNGHYVMRIGAGKSSQTSIIQLRR